MFGALALTLLAAAPAMSARAVPTLGREPVLDGKLADLAPALPLRSLPAGPGATASVQLKLAFRKDTLYLGLDLQDDVLGSDDQLDVTLYFPGSGTTARGNLYRLGQDGALGVPEELAPPPFARPLVRAVTHRQARGMSAELAIPARALPRFQAHGPLLLEVCAEYRDADAPGAEPRRVYTCKDGTPPQGPVRLPDELRKNLKLNPPDQVMGLEARQLGWVGYSRLHSPLWALGDADLSGDALGSLVAPGAVVAPATVASPLPPTLKLADGRTLFSVLTGKDPYEKEGACLTDRELRLALYLVTGAAANRVLEWPAATCSLGRAMRFEITPENQLVIGYTNGSTASFVWSDETFIRTELGLSSPPGHRRK